MPILIVLAGLMGAAGIVLLAIHAAVVIGGGALLRQGLLSRPVGFVALIGFVLGGALFAGDITMRAYMGERLFPMAAPTGGTIMILSWLALAVAALFTPRNNTSA